MDAPGLTKTRILIAIACGILVAFVYTYATVPHLVASPVQVITPVPTPPPVVIGSQPSVSQPFNLKIDNNIWWLVAIMGIIPIILIVLLSTGADVSTMISLLIVIFMLLVIFYAMRAVLDSMLVITSQIQVMP